MTAQGAPRSSHGDRRLSLAFTLALMFFVFVGSVLSSLVFMVVDYEPETPRAPAATAALPKGDALKGAALIERFECNRCHEGALMAKAAQNKQCFGCHRDIMSGAFKAPSSVEAEWRERVEPLSAAPPLARAAGFYRRDWLTRFLLEPTDVRPRLVPLMPRLAMTPDEARDIAAALAPEGEIRDLAFYEADAERGRALVDAKGCGTCHFFTGAAPLAQKPSAKDAPAVTLSPDLRFTRDRLWPEGLVAFLMDPKSVKPETLMPSYPLSVEEARDIALYLLTTPLAPMEPDRRGREASRLPVLTRAVTFDEVERRVFRRTCWHCHGEPDYARGEGGPGNTGGFGFKGRGLSLADYDGVASGMLDEHGERLSVLAPEGGEAPRLLRALLARQDEVRGLPTPGLLGMPLGMPPLSPEEVQLVETWIAQGRRQ